MDVASSLSFLGASLELAAVDLLLGADNAILIALACRPLPPALRPRALAYAVGGAIALRFALAGAASFLMKIPFVKLGGALVLIAIAIELLAHAATGEQNGDALTEPPSYDDRFWRAVVMVIGADAIMSLDNVLALASIAQGNLPLLALGIALGVPALAFGSYFVVQILDRLPWLVIVGAALLGWVSGQMAITDGIWRALAVPQPPIVAYAVHTLCALFVVVWWRFGPKKEEPTPLPHGFIPPKAQKAIDYLATARRRKRRALLAAISLAVAASGALLVFLAMRT